MGGQHHHTIPASSRDGDNTTPYQPTCTETVSPSLEQMARAASPVCTASSQEGETTTPYNPPVQRLSPSLEQMARAASLVCTASSQEGETTTHYTTHLYGYCESQLGADGLGCLTGLHSRERAKPPHHTTHLYRDCESQPGADGPGRLTSLHSQLTREQHHYTIQPTCTETVSPSLEQMARAASPVCTASSRERATPPHHRTHLYGDCEPQPGADGPGRLTGLHSQLTRGRHHHTIQPTCTETVSPSLEQMAGLPHRSVCPASSREGNTTTPYNPPVRRLLAPAWGRWLGRLTSLHSQLARG
jgi:hypothetical protein